MAYAHTDDRERLRGLPKEHAENIGLHILAAYTLEESNPELALEHAKWVARQASRIDFARETRAFVAYRQGDYKLALREFRTAFRMNGFLDYLPFIADCERGVGEPKKAIETAEKSWRNVVAQAAVNGLPTPAFASSLSYFDGLRSKRLPAALIQGQRGYFGAHTYQRVDQPGAFHTLWAEPGREEIEA